MALTITSAGSGQSTTDNTTLTISSVTASVGDVLLLCIAAVNTGGSGVAAVINSIADNAGSSTNVYSQRGTTGNYTPGAIIGDGASQFFFECPVTTALSGATITITFSANNPQKAAEVYRMQPGVGETVAFVSVGTASGGNRTSHSASTVSVTNGHTIFAMAAAETDDAITGDSDTTNGSWSTISTILADAGADPSSMSCSSQYKTVNATGNQSWACTTGSSRDSVANTIIYGIPKSIVAGAGSYTVTGTAATPKLGRKTVAAAGSYAITGTAATAKHGWKVVADAGNYAITGTAASPKLGRRTVADAGSYTFSGTDATLTYTPTGSTYTVVAGAGSYTFTGTAASPLQTRRTTAGAGAYSFTGTAADPKLGRKVSADTGGYAISGSAASVLHGYKIAALAGSYAIVGTAASMRRTWRITANDGAYVITGSTASFVYAQIVIEYVSPGHERCMRCGKIRGRSRLRQEWTGLLVCEATCWEPRHPQMALRGVPDAQTVPWARPDPEPIFLNPGDVSASDL